MPVKQPCPRCGGVSWYEIDSEMVVQRCLCGLFRSVYCVKSGMAVQHTQPTKEARLPRVGSMMAACLKEVARAYPNSIRTREVALLVELTTSEASAQLAVLMHKGLVEKTDFRRGRFGGSSWQITRRAVSLLGVKEV